MYSIIPSSFHSELQLNQVHQFSTYFQSNFFNLCYQFRRKIVRLINKINFDTSNVKFPSFKFPQEPITLASSYGTIRSDDFGESDFVSSMIFLLLSITEVHCLVSHQWDNFTEMYYESQFALQVLIKRIARYGCSLHRLSFNSSYSTLYFFKDRVIIRLPGIPRNPLLGPTPSLCQSIVQLHLIHQRVGLSFPLDGYNY